MEKLLTITIFWREANIEPLTLRTKADNSGFDQLGNLKIVTNEDNKLYCIPLGVVKYYTMEEDKIAVISQFPKTN